MSEPPQKDRECLDGDSLALAGLCGVSITLNTAATPCLYHVPITNTAIYLLPTLLERPDLARHVRELHCDRLSGWPRTKQIKVRDIMHLVPDCNDPPAALLLFDRLRQYRPPGVVHGDKTWDSLACCPEWEFIEDHQRNVSLMSLLPNLDTITVLFVWHWPCIGHLRLSRGYLPQLKTASITGGDTQCPGLSRQLGYLAEAAPNLTSLNLSLFYMTPEEKPDEDYVFPNVTHLSIDHAILDEDVVDFLTAFPRLESLALHAEVVFSSRHNNLLVLIAGSKPCRQLKSLSLDTFEFLCVTESGIAPGELLASMAENLEVLKVDQACIGITDQPDKAVFFTRTRDEVSSRILGQFDLLQSGYVQSFNVKSLPTSLKALHIFCYYWADPENLWQAVLKLAHAAPQRLPNLKKIVLEFNGSFKVDGGLKSTWEDAAVWDEVGIDLVCTPAPLS